MFNQRTPFYFVGTIFLFTTLILTLWETFQKKNESDFFPQGGYYKGKYILEVSTLDKLVWYFSQLTNWITFLLFLYFFMSLLKVRSDKFFKMIASPAITISVLYFYFLYPKQSLKIYQLPFSNLFSHFMIIFFVIGEVMYITRYTIQETTYCLYFILMYLLFVYVNYLTRGVWSYDMIRLDSYDGWSMVFMGLIIVYAFSLLLYVFKLHIRQ
jgi:hypothetical protein